MTFQLYNIFIKISFYLAIIITNHSDVNLTPFIIAVNLGINY